MAIPSEPASPDASPALSVEDKLNNLFGGGQPAVEGDDSPEPDPDSEVGDAEAEEPAEEPAAESASEALEDVEFDGRTWQVPKDLKPAIMHTADYTRKTQDIAAERRLLDGQKQAVETQAAWQQHAGKGLAVLEALDGQLADYGRLNWAEMDTDTLMRTRIGMEQLKERRESVAQTLQGAYQQFQTKLKDSRNAMLAASEEYLSRNVPKWNDQTAQDLSKYAKSEGLTDAEMNAFDNPKLIRMAWKAQQYDKLQASKSANVKRAEDAPPVLKPGATNPLNQSKVERMNFRKSVKAAPNSRAKADLIRQRLEKMYS